MEFTCTLQLISICMLFAFFLRKGTVIQRILQSTYYVHYCLVALDFTKLKMFETLYSALLIAGLFSEKPLQGNKAKLFKAYMSATFGLCAYSIVCMSKAAFTINKLTYSLGMTIIGLWAVSNMIYFNRKDIKIKRFLTNIKKLNSRFDNDKLLGKGYFGQQALKYNSQIQKYMKIHMITQGILPCLNGVFKFLQYLKVFGLSGEVSHIIPPLNTLDYTNLPILYAANLALEVLILIYESSKQVATKWFFISMFLHVTLYFKHLRKGVDNLFASRELNPTATTTYLRLRDNVTTILETDQKLEVKLEDPNNRVKVKELNKSSIDENIKAWVTLHQEALKVSRELIKLYNPMLLVQFLMVYGILVLNMSTVTSPVNVDKMEMALVALYGAMVMSIFFVMCVVGDILNYHSLLVIGERSLTPLQISIYYSDTFILGRSTFVWVMRSVVTVTLALIEIINRKN